MSVIHVLLHKRWPKRFGPLAARLFVLAVLGLHGLGSAAEAASPAMGQGQVQVVAAETDWLLKGVAARDQWPVQSSASAPRVSRPEAPQLGGGDCCQTPTCRCGCLYAMGAIAIAALGGSSHGE